jgi:hypothetical protein
VSDITCCKVQTIIKLIEDNGHQCVAEIISPPCTHLNSRLHPSTTSPIEKYYFQLYRRTSAHIIDILCSTREILTVAARLFEGWVPPGYTECKLHRGWPAKEQCWGRRPNKWKVARLVPEKSPWIRGKRSSPSETLIALQHPGHLPGKRMRQSYFSLYSNAHL